MIARVRRAVAALVVAAASAVAVAQFTVDASLTLLTPQVAVDEPARVEVRQPFGLDFDLVLDWGDGTRTDVDRFGPSVQTFAHAYATVGVRTIRLFLPDDLSPDGEMLVDVAVVTVGSLAALELRPAVAGVGEPFTARVTAGPAGGRVDWGDGAFDVLAGGNATLAHAYAAPGAYTVRLLDAGGGTLDLGVASVTAAPLTFLLPAVASVGVPVEAAVDGLAANAPAGARLAWGDGGVDVLVGDGRAGHVYVRPGTYVVRLERLPDGLPLAVAAVTAEVGGTLAVVGDAVRFAPTRFEAEGLAPGLAHEVAFGDGASQVVVADPTGRLAVEHVYATPFVRATAVLALVEGGQRTVLDTLAVPLALPPARETLAATATADAVAGRIVLDVAVDGLLPGLAYAVRADAVGETLVARVGDAGGTARFVLDREADVALELVARLDLPAGGAVDERRAATTAVARWPRGGETLALEGAPAPILASDVVTVVAEGLVAGYGYALVLNGDAARPYLLPRADGAPWRVDVPLMALGPTVDLELVARFPGPLPTTEPRASLRFETTTPTGRLALPQPWVPFQVPSPVWVRDLTPGLAYRVAFADGTEARFTAGADGALDLVHAFRSTATVALFVDRPGADRVPVATVAPSGVTLAGRLGWTVDVPRYLATGEVTMQVRGVAPGYTYVVDVGGGRRVEGVADADGALDLVAVDPGREAFLYMRVFDGEPFVARTRLDALPPRVLRFFGGGEHWAVRVTELELDAEGRTHPSDLRGRGLLENFVVGGRLQEPIALRFEGVRAYVDGLVLAGAAGLAGPVDLALPFAVRGVEVALDTLAVGAFGVRPQLAGTVAIPTGERRRFDQVVLWQGRPSEGFMIPVFYQAGAERALPDGVWRYGMAPGSFTMVDLSVASDYNLLRADGRNALQHAYDGWADVGRAPPLEPGRWVGVLYTDAELRTGGGDGVAPDVFRADVAWTSAGASAFTERELGTNGVYEWGGWRFTGVTGLALSIVEDRVVRFTRPSGRLRLEWFGQDVPVAFAPDGAGWRVRTLAPVAQDYGSTAVVGGVGTFVRVGVDRWALRFPNALWALDGDLAADPATVDVASGEALLASLPPTGDLGEDLAGVYDDAVATAETALNLYRLQLLLKDLTLHPDGAVDLGGQAWRTLARVPALDLFGFPYLGAGAEIGVRRQGGRYGIGLRGDLKVAEVVEATAAPSWFEHADGRAARWVFEGVGAKFGDFEGSPVTFAVALGGVIDVQRGDLSFTGAGSLTLPDVLSVEAIATFGVVQQAVAGPDFFWYVGAAVDLAAMGRPIHVNVSGVDVLAFYAFRGGLASKLRLDVGAGDCRVDDGNVPQGVLPSIAANALDCYDPDLALSLLAGTVIGSPVQGGAGSEGYGILWHLEANLVVNLGRGGDLQLAGRGWIGRSVADGYGQRGVAPEQLAGRLVVNAEGISGSLCAGPVQTGAGVIDCSGLDPATLRAGGVLIAEFRGAIEFKASWATAQYYFALGTQRNPVYAYVIPRYAQAYLVLGYVRDPGILHGNVRLPAGGVWVGAESGFRWDYAASGNAICNWSVYAGAGFGFGGSLGLQAVPSFQLSAALTAHAWARAGGSICGKSLSVAASIRATGRLTAPNPTEFRGDFDVKIELPVVPDIDVTVRNVGVRLN